MGWIKDAKATKVAADAAKARDAGQTVFAVMLNSPATHPGLSGEIPDWSLMVTAIEAEGWRLEQWTASVDSKGRPQAYPLFRRA